MTWCCAFATHPMQNNAECILQELYESTGNYQIAEPQIKIVDSEDKIASYSYRKNMIVIEQKAIEVCRSFGKDSLNALAFIIGHELAHAYKGKEKNHNNQTSFLAYDRHFQADVREEKLADIQGAFNAYLAGFDTVDILSKLIEALYKKYDLIDKQIYGYPQLKERMKTSQEVENIVDTLIRVFESANYLTALGHYEIATEYYNYILQYYIGKELLNNQGVLKILSALEVGGKNVDPYLLPMELDVRSRLNKTRADNLSYKELMRRKVLLKKALLFFDRVIQFDKNYFPAQLNKICFLILNENYKEALDFYSSNKFQQLLKSNRLSKVEKDKANIALGVAHAFLGQKDQKHIEQARKVLTRLVSNSNQLINGLAAYNLSVLTKSSKVFPNNNRCNLSFSKDAQTKVDEVTPYKYINVQSVYLDQNQNAAFYSEKLPNSVVLVASWQGQPIILQRIKSNTILSKGDLKNGLPVKYLFEKLEENSFNIIQANDGYFVNCFTCQLIFKINKQGKITEWAKVF